MPRFQEKVRKYQKTQAIRPFPRKMDLMPKVGELYQLKGWMGKPYRSKQELLGLCKLIQVSTITIEETRFLLNNETGSESVEISDRLQLENFARDDGFEDWKDFKVFLRGNYGLPFTGYLMKWKKYQPKLER